MRKELSNIMVLSLLGLSIAPNRTIAEESILSHPEKTQIAPTDKEAHEDKNFVNVAKGNQIIEEECAKMKSPERCKAGQAQNTSFMGVDSQLVKGVAKAYSVVMGTQSKFESEDKDGKSKKTRDYCAMIGAGSETVSTAMEAVAGQRTVDEAKGDTDQRKIFYSAARLHRDRAKAASIPAYGWSAATSCYALHLSFLKKKRTKGSMSKTAAAAILSKFYWGEAKNNNKYSDKMIAIAKKLPGKGDCSPLTEPDCYCSFKEYQNDTKYCSPGFHKDRVAFDSLRVACTDDQLKADPKCNCAKTDSCFDKVLASEFTSPDFGKAFMNSKDGYNISRLARGELTGGALSSAAKNNSALQNFMDRMGSDLPDVESLTEEQEKSAKAVAGFGIPPKLARHFASVDPGPNHSKALAKFQGRARGLRKSSLRNLRTSGGKGLMRRKRNSATNNAFDINKYLKKKKKRTRKAAGEIINFNQKALSKTQINKNKNANIFKIISRRYMISGRKRLGVR